MGIMNMMGRSKAGEESQFSSQTATPARADSTVEKNNGLIDDSPVKYLTWRSFILGLCVSMGGFIFGYSTGKPHSCATCIEPSLGHGKLTRP